MAYHKATENIIGQMAVFTRAISVMEPDMDMGFGKVRKKLILARTGWTIRKGLVCILGKIRKFTRDSFETIIEMDMGRVIQGIG